MTDDRSAGYLLDNATDGARRRLELLAELFDPWTSAHFDRIGVAEGWRCWEVGAGGPSIARALATRVGPTGFVLATDLEIAPALEAAAPNVEVCRHDVANDAVPDGGFDLVHARLVLVHVPERALALAHMVDALVPGGFLLVEDADPALQPLACLEGATEETARANHIRSGFRSLMADRSVDLAFGRSLARRLRDAGLEDVRAEAYFPVADPRCSELELATLTQIGPRLLDARIVTVDDLEAHRRAVASGRLDLVQPPLVSAWGRAPLRPA